MPARALRRYYTDHGTGLGWSRVRDQQPQAMDFVTLLPGKGCMRSVGSISNETDGTIYMSREIALTLAYVIAGAQIWSGKLLPSAGRGCRTPRINTRVG